jgi:hypothetical protein
MWKMTRQVKSATGPYPKPVPEEFIVFLVSVVPHVPEL